MSLKHLLLFSGLALASTVPTTLKRCSTGDPPAALLEAAQEFRTEEAAALQAGQPIVQEEELKVNVYFHAIASTEEKLIADDVLKEQFKVLVDTFAPSGISFNLVETNKFVHPTWAIDKDNFKMMEKIRKGSYKDLNFYFQEKLWWDGIGYCTYPLPDIVDGTQDHKHDGCHIHTDTLPGKGGRFGMGKTATHEAGHWFGLWHTFSEKCDGKGDEIDDTPAQNLATMGCPKDKDSCPDMPGKDPVNNYMDYSDDVCLEEFTKGQKTRMFNMFKKFRSNYQEG